MSNICCKCYYHEICSEMRYENIKMKYMIQIRRKKNKDGNIIIFVEKCQKYKNRKFKYPKMDKKIEKNS